MTIALGFDHAGFIFKGDIVQYLTEHGHQIIDKGANDMDQLDDFPGYAQLVCKEIQSGNAERGILVCGTGVGMCIAANRHAGIRAVVTYNPEIAKISRSHNDTNIACFGGRTMEIGQVLASLEEFLTTDFIGGKYQKRNEMVDSMC